MAHLRQMEIKMAIENFIKTLILCILKKCLNPKYFHSKIHYDRVFKDFSIGKTKSDMEDE